MALNKRPVTATTYCSCIQMHMRAPTLFSYMRAAWLENTSMQHPEPLVLISAQSHTYHHTYHDAMCCGMQCKQPARQEAYASQGAVMTGTQNHTLVSTVQ
jgi:hypothetical protein